MKKSKPQPVINKLYLLIFVFIALTALVIESCKKDSHTEQQAAVTDPAVAQAKSWYESTYPVNTGKLNTQATGTSPDWSLLVKPDWQHNASYVRFNDDVIEMPLDASAKMAIGLKNNTPGQAAYDPNNSRSSFLLLKQAEKYNAYIMTVIADAAYLKGDLTKLDRNKYNKRDSNFSGAVIYNTPKGKFVNGWFYKNGIITGRIEAGGGPAVNKPRDGGKNIQSLKPDTYVYIEICIDWYQTGTGIDEPIYLGTSCTTTVGGDGGGGGGSTGGSTGGGGGGGGGSGGSSSPPAWVPPPCPDNYPVVHTQSTGHSQVVNIAKPPEEPLPVDGGNGYPPPTYQPPCTVAVTTPIFGINNSNAQVPDANFDDLLNYVNSLGLTYSDPYNVILDVNGVKYKGECTDIYNPDGTVIHYFSPDLSSGPFKTGIEYAIGSSKINSNSVNTSNSFDFGGIRVGSPSVYLGNGPVTYTPTGSGGALLTLTQRQALETADNNRLLKLMQQEDAKDDAAISPCHGTARNGNVRWPGTAEHWLIQFDYIASNPAALREYIVPGSSGKLNGNPGYADIVNPLTNEMFEIKPAGPFGQAAGATEVQLYVTQGNLRCPPANGGAWVAGGNYPTRYLPDPKNPSNVLVAKLSSAGVIVYNSESRNGAPQPVPVVLPENLTEKLKQLVKDIQAHPSMQQQLVINFVRQNPRIIPYLKGAAAGVIIATILEDIASEGAGVLDDWQSFLIARTLWRVANGIVII